MKSRRHHNNKGHRQIKNGSTRKQVEAMAKRLRKEIADRVPSEEDLRTIAVDPPREWLEEDTR